MTDSFIPSDLARRLKEERKPLHTMFSSSEANGKHLVAIPDVLLMDFPPLFELAYAAHKSLTSLSITAVDYRGQ